MSAHGRSPAKQETRTGVVEFGPKQQPLCRDSYRRHGATRVDDTPRPHLPEGRSPPQGPPATRFGQIRAPASVSLALSHSSFGWRSSGRVLWRLKDGRIGSCLLVRPSPGVGVASLEIGEQQIADRSMR